MTIDIFLIGPTAMLILGVYMLVKIIKKKRLIKASKDWPMVVAMVLKKEVVRRQIANKGSIYYYSEYKYKYSVFGSEYIHYAHLDADWYPLNALKTLNAIEDTLEVHYNPEKPKEHTSKYDKVRLVDYFPIMCGIAFGVLGIAFRLFNLLS